MSGGAAAGIAATRALAEGVTGRMPTVGGGSRRIAVAGNPLRIPPTFSGDTLTAAVTRQNIWSDVETDVWTYNGSYPGPTIRVNRGDTFTVKLVNNLTEPTITHWHGLIVPHKVDGHPMDAIDPGETFDYSFTVDQCAATCWYHPHPHTRTGPQVYMGLSGLFIIEDDEERALGLPDGEFDVPLVIADRRAVGSHQFAYELVGDDHTDGYLGDTLLVNGTPDPYLDVVPGLYRFRILNASNARILTLGFEDGRLIRLIGTDGGLLDRPYDVSLVSLAPAERVEIIVDFSGDLGSSVVLKSIRTTASVGDPPPQGVEMQVIRFDVVGESTKQFQVPEQLSTIVRYDSSEAVGERQWEMGIYHPNPEIREHLINGLTYDMQRIDAQVPLGDLEIWTFKNTSFLPHPMHVHGTQFQILDRAGNTKLVPQDMGWKDTVLVPPSQKLRILVRMTPHTGVYLVHCHNLEHEDHGMMSNFEVVEKTTGVEDTDRSKTLNIDLR